MSQPLQPVVLCGAVSPEREVSLRSGRAVAGALPGCRLVERDRPSRVGRSRRGLRRL